MNFPPKTIIQMERISKTYNLFLVIHLFQSFLRRPQQFHSQTVLLKWHHRTYTPKGSQNNDTHTTWACSRDNVHTIDCSNKDDVCPSQNCSGNDMCLVLETEATWGILFASSRHFYSITLTWVWVKDSKPCVTFWAHGLSQCGLEWNLHHSIPFCLPIFDLCQISKNMIPWRTVQPRLTGGNKWNNGWCR